jgi:hypothetical protein
MNHATSTTMATASRNSTITNRVAAQLRFRSTPS